LRAYAGVFIVREPGGVRLIPDAPRPPSFAFTNSTGEDAYVEPDYWADDYTDEGDTPANYVADSIKLKQAKRGAAATVVTVMWTPPLVRPWQARPWQEIAPGVEQGSIFWREEQVQMPGIQDAGFAKRACLRRLNEYTTSDLTGTLIATGEAIQCRRGDVVSVT